MASHQPVQSRGGRVIGTQQTQNVQQQTLPAYPVDSPLWKYVAKIGPKEKNKGGGSCLWNCNRCKINFTGLYTRVKAHFLWLEGDHGVHHCKKITRKDVEGFQAEQDAADIAKAERRSSRQQSFSKRGNEVPLIVEEARKRQNLGPLTKMFWIWREG